VLLFVACGSNDSGDEGGPTAVDPRSDGGDQSDGDQTSPSDGAASCGKPPAKTGSMPSQKVTVNGVGRTYALYVPDSYDASKAYPLVIAFHGDGGTGEDLRDGWGKSLEAASGQSAIFAYPDGASGDTAWIIDTYDTMMADIAFGDAVIAQIQQTYCIDPKGALVFGFSRGAFFANQFVCRTKSTVRAVVANSGGGPFPTNDAESDQNGNPKCTARPVASVQVIGDADDLLPDAQRSRDYWVGANACGSSTTAYDPSPCVAYDGCASGRPEVYCEISGMGHQIGANTANLTWSFFSAL